MTHPADKAYGVAFGHEPYMSDEEDEKDRGYFRAGWDAMQREIGKGIPSVADVASYCKERGNRVNPQAWWDHYQSNGWMVGRNKLKDWKAAVRTWERDRFNQQPQQQEMRAINR